MDSLPDSLLLQILSRLNDSADVARCRVASKAFDAVFPGLRSINLRYSQEWHSRATINHRIRPLMTVFLDLISKLETVESICIIIGPLDHKRARSDVFDLTDEDFAKEWLSRVSGSLKSLSITDRRSYMTGPRSGSFLSLISKSCHNLVNLELTSDLLSVDNLNTMPMLTSLTLESVVLEEEDLNKLNKCFPNLQFLKLVDVFGVTSTIHFLNLKACVLKDSNEAMPHLTIITPNLITLTIDCIDPVGFHIEAPMLSHFRLNLNRSIGCEFELKKFKNLKTFWLSAYDIGFFLSRFPISKTVETLTLDTEDVVRPPGEYASFEVTLGKVFTVFPNLSSLCIKYGAWAELEAWLKPQCREILYGGAEEFETNCPCYKCFNSDTWLKIVSGSYPQYWDGRKGLKRFCAYLTLDDPELTFSCLACVLEQCVGLSEVSLLIFCSDVNGVVSKAFMSKCMDHWPMLIWRWGIWSWNEEDSWITDALMMRHM